MDRPIAWVVYESVFGNTRAVAEAIGRGLSDRFEARVLEVSHADPELPNVALLVVGGPVHAFGMSRERTREDARRQAHDRGREPVSQGIGVREWLMRLRSSQGHVDAAVFDTAAKVGWFVMGSAARGEASVLRGRGYDVVTPPEHFLVKDVDGPLLAGELERAVEWGRALARVEEAASAAAIPAIPTGR